VHTDVIKKGLLINQSEQNDSQELRTKLKKTASLLFKSGELRAPLDEIELSYLVRIPRAKALSVPEQINKLGTFGDVLVREGADFRSLLSCIEEPVLVVSMENIKTVGDSCLADAGIYGASKIQGTDIPLHFIGRRAYNMAGKIMELLNRNPEAARLPLPEGLSTEDAIKYFYVFAKRFPEYQLVISNARLLDLVNMEMPWQHIIRPEEQEKKEDLPEKLRELNLPGLEAFQSLIDTSKSLDSLIEYDVHAQLLRNPFNNETKINIHPDYVVRALPTEDAQDIYLFNALTSLRKAIFLINTFYKDNNIMFFDEEKLADVIFDDRTVTKIKEELKEKIDNEYAEKLGRVGRMFWYPTYAKLMLDKNFQQLMKWIKDYESKIPIIDVAISSDEYRDFKVSPTEGRDVVDLMRVSSLQLLMGIENVLFEIPTYDKERSSEGVKNEIGQDLSKIKKYSDVLRGYIGFFNDVDEELLGYAMKIIVEAFDDKTLEEKLVDDSFRYKMQLYRKTLQAHSMIKSVALSKSDYYKLASTGENIEFILTLANLCHTELSDHINYNQIPEGEEAYTGDIRHSIEDLTIVKKGREKPEQRPDELVDNIVTVLSEDAYFKAILEKASNPFYELWSKLYTCGVPELLARNVENRLKHKYLEIGVSIDKDMTEKCAARMIFNGDSDLDRLITAMKSIFERMHPRSLRKVQYYEVDERLTRLSHIFNDVMVAGTRKGEDDLLYSKAFYGDITPYIEKAARMFPGDDIYCGRINGVAIVFEPSKGGFLRMPGSDLWGPGPIKFQIPIRSIDDKDTYSIFDQLRIKFHELTHLYNNEYRRKWRNLTACYMDVLLNYLIQKYEKGVANNVPFWSSDYIAVHERFRLRPEDEKLNYKEIVLSIMADVSTMALGKGERAERMRRRGFFEGISTTLNSSSEGFFKSTKMPIDSIKWEESLIAQKVEEALYYITTDKVGGLRELKEFFRKYNLDMGIIEETSAEVTSYIAMRYFTDLVKEHVPEADIGKLEKVCSQFENTMAFVSEISRGSDSIFSQFGNDPILLERELNRHGMTYKRVMSYEGDVLPIISGLIGLGFTDINWMTAFADYSTTTDLLLQKGKDPSQFLLPANRARNYIGRMYRQHIPEVMTIFDAFGPNGAEIIDTTESLQQVLDIAKVAREAALGK